MRVGLDVQASFHSYFWGCMVGDGSYKRSGGGGGGVGKAEDRHYYSFAFFEHGTSS